MFGGRVRVQVFIERQYLVLGWNSAFQENEEIYIYGK